MDKNWLIRTKSNHILGPISKEKVLELYHNNSIKPDDEICSGNGFWFFIREEDMVKRFILGEEVQGFNPISEAKDVLTQGASGKVEEPVTATEDITLVGGLNLAMLNDAPPATPVTPEPVSVAAEAPPLETKPKPAAPKPETAPSGPQKKNNAEVKAKAPSKSAPKKNLKKQSYLKYLGVIGFIFLFLMIYFRKAIIRSLFQGEMTAIEFSLINTAHAQDVLPLKKKAF